jgi:uncharacterized protein (DUF1800 family)
MADKDIALMAHLMRRAAFGAPYEELLSRATKGYEATVEELLHPETQPDIDWDIATRGYPEWVGYGVVETGQAIWAYRMINTRRPLQEKIALFWHGILCTGVAKCEHTGQVGIQLEMFRQKGMGSFRDLLVGLAQDPAMVFYLDNCMSHKDAINENWGRELLELFSMGVGMDGRPNYTEEDVQEASRAFTGWTITNGIPSNPYGRYESHFVYNPFDHDNGTKTFLGETGNFNGEDIVDIICKQPATARFISRHLYNFFVADEPLVPAWQHTPPRDPEAIRVLEDEYFRSNYDIGSMLRVLLNSDFFKEARFAKVKSPTEVVIGTLRLAGEHKTPKPGLWDITDAIRYMGQDLFDPPTVEGWHTGREWIDSGTLVERINFVAEYLGNEKFPGIRDMIHQVGSTSTTVTAEEVIDGCLEMLGAYRLHRETREQLIDHLNQVGDLRPGAPEFNKAVGQTLQMIAATMEYQFA